MDERLNKVEGLAEAAFQMACASMISLDVVLKAISKQRLIDQDQLVRDINQALLAHELDAEQKSERGLPSASREEYVLIRASLANALPGLAVR